VSHRKSAGATKQDIAKTMRFARSNPERSGALTPASLYNEVIPDLIKRGLARALPREGKGHMYQCIVESK
jgi:hypothetical protein